MFPIFAGPKPIVLGFVSITYAFGGIVLNIQCLILTLTSVLQYIDIISIVCIILY